jgi:hypothetical protein
MWIYATIAFFIALMVLTAIVAQQTPVEEVKYENGRVVPKAK